MIKIFTNIWPNKYTRVNQEFSEEYINKLFANTDIETTMAFDTNCVISLLLLDQATICKTLWRLMGLMDA